MFSAGYDAPHNGLTLVTAAVAHDGGVTLGPEERANAARLPPLARQGPVLLYQLHWMR